MIQISGDLWDVQSGIVLIPTNGTIRSNSRAVMGAGVAKELCNRHPDKDAPRILGRKIAEQGNEPHSLFSVGAVTHWSFPTKGYWRKSSDTGLIKRCAYRMREKLEDSDKASISFPLLGCGCGGLDWWRDVAPILNKAWPEDYWLAIHPANSVPF